MSMLHWSGRFSNRRLSAQVLVSGVVLGLVMLALAVGLAVTAPAVRAQGQQGQGVPDQGALDLGAQVGTVVDPPSRVARISLLAGSVSVESAGQEQFSAAEANYPLTTGDRMYADVGSNGELQTGQLAVRLGQQTDVTVTAMTDTLAQFGLGQGSVHLRSFGIDAGETVELDTPNVAVTVLQPGDVRVDVDPNSNATTVTLLTGQVQVDGNGLQQVLEPGQRVRLSGSDPVAAQWLQGSRGDGLDRFSSDRDQMYETAQASESEYVNPGTIGAEDLSSYGSWETDGDYGGVWYPRGVAVDWQPYSQGHWAYIAPWGWTWVESEPWGFAPFHYGRWGRFGNRWGWIPGPPVVRPVYSPALVVFVGGPRLANGGGVMAWFPLGPREPYQPWYRTSTVYVNRVNVSNIYNRNAAEVRRNYEQRTTNIYINNTVQNRVYVNRQVATVAMPEGSFAAGRGVAREAVRLNPRDLAGAPVLQRPAVAPERTMGAPARPVPPRVAARPALATHVEAGAAQGGFGGGRPGDSRTQPAPISRPVTNSQPATSSQPAPITRAAPANGGASTTRPAVAPLSEQGFKPLPAEAPAPVWQPKLPVNREQPAVSNEQPRGGVNRPVEPEPPVRGAPMLPVKEAPAVPAKTVAPAPAPAATKAAPAAPAKAAPPAKGAPPAKTPPPPPPKS